VLYSGGVAFVAKLPDFHFDAADPARNEIVNAADAAVHLDEKICSGHSDRKPSALERVAIQRSVFVTFRKLIPNSESFCERAHSKLGIPR
jgi:hypothetical protein